jgi:[protein-PII] uridylyltransferase
MPENAPASIAQVTSQSHGVPGVKVLLERQRAQLRAMLDSPHTAGVALAQRHAQVMDDIVRRLYASASFDHRDSSVLVGAVGGYGRRLLGWKSDVDVCFVTREGPDALQPIVDEMLYPLWDAGVSVGHQVLTIGDAVAAAVDDLPTATELLDFRVLAGDRRLGEDLQQTLLSSVFADSKVGDFIARLEEHTSARHQRFGDSVYLLEPDVKNGTGGLRDLDFSLWAARARFRTSDLSALCALGVLPLQRIGEIRRALDFVWSVRNHLHECAGRRSDRLTFVEQESVARALGYGARIAIDPAESALQHTGAMVEAFMSDYYRQARVITHLSEQIMGHAKRRTDRPRPKEEALGEGLVSCEGGIGLVDTTRLLALPAAALRLYASAVARDKPVLARSRDAVSEAAADPEFCARLRDSREACALFVQLVGSCRKSAFKSGSIVSELHDVGLLLAMIPEFLPVVGRVHHDIYHVYTVDVHSVAAVDRLHTLARGELATEHPLGCRLAAEIARPRMLALATLLHDVGKAIGGHNHAQRGAEMARSILERLGLPPEDVDDACHLILKHLALYVVAARRDLGDPSTIEDFAREVRGREGLRDLYLLTVADLSTTSPKAMTKWKAGMVDALWRATDARLSGGNNVEPARVARVRALVRESWPVGADLCALDDYLDTMPERYLLANTPDEIVAHALVATQPREAHVAATLVPSKHEDVLELCVVTDGRASTGLCVVAGDRPGLLASISAAISANRLRIQAAQIHSRPLAGGGVQAVDLFWVHLAQEDELTLSERMAKLEHELNALIAGTLAPRDLLRSPQSSRWSARPLPPVQTEVVVEHHASSCHTIIEVLTEDRSALLFTLAEALHSLGLTISIAKISTEGTRVIDVFYVTEADGKKVEPGPRTEQVKSVLLSALGEVRSN